MNQDRGSRLEERGVARPVLPKRTGALGEGGGVPSRLGWRSRLPGGASVRRPGPIILMYHQVAELGNDRWELAVTPRHFAEHMQVLARRRRPVALRRLTDELDSQRLDPLRVAITFDDGYLDNLTNARPILEQFEIPATVFVVGDGVGREREFWWDELDRLLLGDHPLPSNLRLRLAGREHQWELRAGGDRGPRAVLQKISRARLHRWLWRRLRALPGAERWQVIETLRAWARMPVEVRHDRRSMTAPELRRLAADGLIEIGAHTATHPRLAALAPAEQLAEIQRGKERLETLVELPVSSFAYPFGGRFDVSTVTVDAVQQAGFARACTTRPGTVQRGTNPFRLPRLYVADWSGDEFERELAPWL